MNHSDNINTQVATHKNAINTIAVFAGHGFDTEKAAKNLFQRSSDKHEKIEQVIHQAA